jgi:hypothetical protein
VKTVVCCADKENDKTIKKVSIPPNFSFIVVDFFCFSLRFSWFNCPFAKLKQQILTFNAKTPNLISVLRQFYKKNNEWVKKMLINARKSGMNAISEGVFCSRNFFAFTKTMWCSLVMILKSQCSRSHSRANLQNQDL